MDSKQQIEFLREKRKEAGELIKDLKSQMKQDANNEELEHKLQDAKDAAKQLKIAHRNRQPSVLSQVLGWISLPAKIAASATGHGTWGSIFGNALSFLQKF